MSQFQKKPAAKPTPSARRRAKTEATDVKPVPPRPAPRSKVSEWYAPMLADLARSGLEAADARAMRLVPCSRGEDPAIYPAGAGYRIPYFTRSGQPRDDVYRYRFLEDTATGFAKLVGQKQRRYSQPAGSPPGVYWAPFTDWEAVAADAGIGVVVTEGEKKAALCTKLGLPCIGLGGVWSFRSKARNNPLLPELASLNWADRTVWIVYDSDAVTNPDVCRAEWALAEELSGRGAAVKIVRLPPGEGGAKQGLDDYLVSGSVDDFVALLDSTEDMSLSAELHRLNAEVTYVRRPGGVFVHRDNQLLRASDFTNHAFSNRLYTVVVGAGDKMKMVERSAASEWLKWRHRSEVSALAFEPGLPAITDKGELNLWRGFPYEPKKGPVRLWQQLLDFIFAGDTASRSYFEKWAAYPFQHPGTKIYSAVGIWGRAKGTGKSLLGYTIGSLYGDAFYEIGDEQLRGQSTPFNEWAKHRHFVLADEITSTDSRTVGNRIKYMITRERVEINTKNTPQYSLRDCINYIFTANGAASFYVEPGDRRLFIHEVVADQPLAREFYREFVAWSRSEEGRRALMWHFTMGVDVSDFDPGSPPPYTEAKQAMEENGQSELDAWLSAHLVSEEGVRLTLSKFGGGDLIMSHEVLALIEADGLSKPSSSLLGRKMIELGRGVLRFETSKPGVTSPQMTVGGRLVRVYPLRNADKWREKNVNEVRAAIEKLRDFKPQKF